MQRFADIVSTVYVSPFTNCDVGYLSAFDRCSSYTGALPEMKEKSCLFIVYNTHFLCAFFFLYLSAVICYLKTVTLYYNLTNVTAQESKMSVFPIVKVLHRAGVLFSDSVPHIPDADHSWEKVNIVLHNVTKYLKDTFENTTIIPSIGNHDAWPVQEVSSMAVSFLL